MPKKNDLILVDTSVFIDFFRGVADDTLSVLILDNRVLLSQVVRMELLAGVRKKELSLVEEVLDSLLNIETFAPPKSCEKLITRARGTGLMGGIPDIMILADALRHSSALFTLDKKLLQLAQRLKVTLFEA